MNHKDHSQHTFYRKSLEAQNASLAVHNQMNFNRIGKLETSNLNQNGSAQVKLGSTGATSIIADSTITPVRDPEGRQGWNFINTSASTKFNLYYFSGLQEILTLSQVSSVFTKCYINNFDNLNGAPFLQVYTKPTGSGDHGSFYHSRISYVIDNTVHVAPGEQVILYGGALPNTACNNRLVELKTRNVDGDGGDDEEVLYVVLASDSSAAINTMNVTISSMGFNTVDLGSGKGIINRDFKLITKSHDELLNDKVSSGADQTLASAQQVLAYGEVTAGPGTGELHPIHITQSGDVEVVIADLEVKGQNTMSSSLPVVIASDQSRINTLTLRDLPTNDSQTINALASTTATSYNMDTQGYSKIGFSGSTTNTTDDVILEVSNGSSFRKHSYETAFDGTFYFEVTPVFRYYRISQTDTMTSAFTINLSVSRR